MHKVVCWFSCGINSAVAAKLAVETLPADKVRIVRCVVLNEHPDNDRFHDDVEQWIGRPIERHASKDYVDCWDVWESRRYLSGVKGAPCTYEMKKSVRHELEREWGPDYQVFGFSLEEQKRAERFAANNPEARLLNPLIEHGLTKANCAQMVEGAGLALPALYGLGFKNNNCIGCVKATSPAYWARVRHYFPDVFARMAELSRRLGCRLTRIENKRLFIDEIPADFDWQKGDRSRAVECGVLCGK